MTNKIIAIGNNTCYYIWRFRKNLINSFIAEGYSVVIIGPRDNYTEKMLEIGVEFIEIKMAMNKNPLSDLKLYFNFRKILKALKPDVYLGYTIKPNIYGNLAARHLGIPTINNIAGLGSMFMKDGFLTKLVKLLYRLSLSQSSFVFFQNPDDRALFTNEKIVTHNRYDNLPGSGIDVSEFPLLPTVKKPEEAPFVFLLIGRMLWDKGIGEYVEAARIVKAKHPETEFRLLGSLQAKNPSVIPQEVMDGWVNEGLVTYLGFSDDVKTEFIHSDCVVLPSYREGTPRTLLEAAASGRPIITTDAPGCREVVDDGVNGFLCRLKSGESLAEKMFKMMALTEAQRKKMGQLGHEKVKKEFDEVIVIQKYLNAISELVEA